MASGFADDALDIKAKKFRGMSMEQIIDRLTEIAQDRDDRDSFKALKALSGMNSGTVVLPPPMEVDERIDRLAILMKAMTREQCRVAYHRAHPKAKTEITDSVRLEIENALTAEEVEYCRSISSAKLLMKKFPELKMPRGGVPKGYPFGKGQAAVRDWCYQQAALAIVHRKQKAIDGDKIKSKYPPVKNDAEETRSDPTA